MKDYQINEFKHLLKAVQNDPYSADEIIQEHTFYEYIDDSNQRETYVTRDRIYFQIGQQVDEAGNHSGNCNSNDHRSESQEENINSAVNNISLQKYAISDALALSIQLEIWERHIEALADSISNIPERMMNHRLLSMPSRRSLHGKLG